MITLGHALFFSGVGVLVVAAVWSFVVVFRENVVLGVVCLFLPLGLLAVLIMWFPRTWRPVAAWALGYLLLFSGMALSTPGR